MEEKEFVTLTIDDVDILFESYQKTIELATKMLDEDVETARDIRKCRDSHGRIIKTGDTVVLSGDMVLTHRLYSLTSEMENMVKNKRTYKVSGASSESLTVEISGFNWCSLDLTVVNKKVEVPKVSHKKLYFDTAALV